MGVFIYERLLCLLHHFLEKLISDAFFFKGGLSDNVAKRGYVSSK